MLHVVCIIINNSCPRKRITNMGMSCNLLRVPTFMVLIGQRIFSFYQIYFLSEEGVTEADIMCRKSCCFGLCIQFYDLFEGDIYRPDQD